MSNHILVAICVLAGALASCGSDGSGGGLTGACATLANECAMCNDAFERELCQDVAEDNDQEECAILLDDGNPCNVI